MENYSGFKKIEINEAKVGDVVEWESVHSHKIMFYRIGYLDDIQLWGPRENCETVQKAFKQPLVQVSNLDIGDECIKNIWRKVSSLKEFLHS